MDTRGRGGGRKKGFYCVHTLWMNPTAFCKISALHQNVLYQADISNNKDNEEGIFRSI